ncbi:MAG: hypothetical protein ACKOYH_05155 [Cyanobium sp.]
MFEGEPIQPLLRSSGETPFKDSWEAEAYAIGNLLVKLGQISGREWMTLMAESIQEAQAHGDPDTGKTYYNHWCRSIEKYCFAAGLTTPADHGEILLLWREAVAKTPHGVPLVIENAHRCQEQDHHHGDGHSHSHERSASPPATYDEPIITQIVNP